MEYIKRKCRKCGYEIELPETSLNIICGSCGNVNHYSRISSAAKKKQKSDEVKKESGIKEIKKPSFKSVTARTPAADEAVKPPDEDEIELPEENKFFKIMTVGFILAPFIAMAVEFFKLPPYTLVLIIIIIAVIGYSLKK